jgi:hypothetical protein
MKNKKNIELDVDFIGGERGLTKEEENAISDYIRIEKLKHSKKTVLRNNKVALHMVTQPAHL